MTCKKDTETKPDFIICPYVNQCPKNKSKTDKAVIRICKDNKYACIVLYDFIEDLKAKEKYFSTHSCAVLEQLNLLERIANELED